VLAYEDSIDSNNDSDSVCCNTKVSSESDIENNGEQSKKKRQKAEKYGPGGEGTTPRLWCRKILVIKSLVAIIVAASLAIRHVIMNAEGPTANKKAYSAVEINHVPQPQKQQQLLEMAERVIRACSESKLNESTADCQQLCHSRMCCFHDESGGEYSSSCKEDESKECVVYTGCEALLEGVPVGRDVEAEDEE